MDATRRSLMIGTLAAPVLAGAAQARSAFQTPPPEAGNLSLAWPTPSATIDLWPKGVSGALHSDMREHVEETTTDQAIHFRRVQGISKPRLSVFPAQKPNGGAMLVIPGGGLYWNYFDHEGYQLADFLNRQGLTCFVLFYRLAGDGWDRPADVALIDAQRAMRVIRANAGSFGLDPERLGVAGFSAGGFLTSTLATRHGAKFQDPVDEIDALSARPFLAALIYPVQSVDPAYAYDGVGSTLFGGKVTPEIVKTYSPDRNVGPDHLTRLPGPRRGRQRGAGRQQRQFPQRAARRRHSGRNPPVRKWRPRLRHEGRAGQAVAHLAAVTRHLREKPQVDGLT